MAELIPPKPHYPLLDGLRGVAALIVIVYHVFECYTWSPVPHGYLSVDFFFVLSGFVIGYAYDDRWSGRLTQTGFFRRRLIRLHPMVLLGAVVGAVSFFLQGSVRWDGTQVSLCLVILALLLNVFMLPLPVGVAADVRGNGEFFPLNGPHWSLFFEYVGNILYALLLRRLRTGWLAALSVLSGLTLVGLTIRSGGLGFGWSMIDGGLFTGFVRMLFPYCMGMLMARLFRPLNVRHAMTICSLILLLVAVMPLCFGQMMGWLSGLYDVVCVIIVFPTLVWLGASQALTDGIRLRCCRFLGELSYPLYAVHYPLMYLFYAHIGLKDGAVPIEQLAEVWPEALVLPFACILLAWMVWRLYDRPLRKWLTARTA